MRISDWSSDVCSSDLGEVGRPTGLEPATSGTTNRCSNQLNYDRRMPRLSAHTYRSAQRQGRGPMNRPTTLPNANVTIDKFGFPGTLITEYEHWVVLLRPQAPTLDRKSTRLNSSH